jgi:hypothetical protein
MTAIPMQPSPDLVLLRPLHVLKRAGPPEPRHRDRKHPPLGPEPVSRSSWSPSELPIEGTSERPLGCSQLAHDGTTPSDTGRHQMTRHDTWNWNPCLGGPSLGSGARKGVGVRLSPLAHLLTCGSSHRGAQRYIFENALLLTPVGQDLGSVRKPHPHLALRLPGWWAPIRVWCCGLRGSSCRRHRISRFQRLCLATSVREGSPWTPSARSHKPSRSRPSTHSLGYFEQFLDARPMVEAQHPRIAGWVPRAVRVFTAPVELDVVD